MNFVFGQITTTNNFTKKGENEDPSLDSLSLLACDLVSHMPIQITPTILLPTDQSNSLSHSIFPAEDVTPLIAIMSSQTPSDGASSDKVMDTTVPIIISDGPQSKVIRSPEEIELRERLFEQAKRKKNLVKQPCTQDWIDQMRDRQKQAVHIDEAQEIHSKILVTQSVLHGQICRERLMSIRRGTEQIRNPHLQRVTVDELADQRAALELVTVLPPTSDACGYLPSYDPITSTSISPRSGTCRVLLRPARPRPKAKGRWKAKITAKGKAKARKGAIVPRRSSVDLVYMIDPKDFGKAAEKAFADYLGVPQTPGDLPWNDMVLREFPIEYKIKMVPNAAALTQIQYVFSGHFMEIPEGTQMVLSFYTCSVDNRPIILKTIDFDINEAIRQGRIAIMQDGDSSQICVVPNTFDASFNDFTFNGLPTVTATFENLMKGL